MLRLVLNKIKRQNQKISMPVTSFEVVIIRSVLLSVKARLVLLSEHLQVIS